MMKIDLQNFGQILCGTNGGNLGRDFVKDVARYFFIVKKSTTNIYFNGLNNCRNLKEFGEWLGNSDNGNMPNIIRLISTLINKNF